MELCQQLGVDHSINIPDMYPFNNKLEILRYRVVLNMVRRYIKVGKYTEYVQCVTFKSYNKCNKMPMMWIP